MALQLDDTGKNTVEQDKNHRGRDYFDGPVGMNLPSNAEDVGSIPGLFEGKPVDEGTTRRGTDTRVHRPEKPAGPTDISSGLSPCKQLERQTKVHFLNRRLGVTLLCLLCRDHGIRVRNGEEA